jgi:UDP-N-acetyl-D-glucosamine 4,6-dehydratase
MRDLFRPTALKRVVFFLTADLILSGLTLYLAYLLRFNFQIPEEFLGSFWLTYSLITGAKVFSLFIFKSYFIIWRFFSFYDAKNILKAHILAYVFFIIFYLSFQEYFAPFPRSVIIMDFFLSLIFIGTLRGVKRFISEGRREYSMKPTLIIGANSKTTTIIQSALKEEIDYYPAAIICTEEDERMADSYINNVKVFDISSLEGVIEKKKIMAAILTEKLSQNELKGLVDRLNKAGVTEIKQVKILGSEYEKLENLSIEDLLARHPQDLDIETISAFIKGKSVLITGAGGV